MTDLTLPEFILARVADWEAMAQAANGPRWAPGDGNVSEGGLYALQGDTEDGWAIAWFELGTANEAADGSRQLPRWPKMKHHAHENAVHAAAHDPARVLAQCAAYRSIVELHHPDRHLENWYWLERKCAECGHIWHKWVPDKKPTDIGPEQGCPTMRALATIWADHPDFRPEWRL